MVKVLHVKATAPWGWSIKAPGQSAAQTPIPVPPPSTLLGALAYPYFTFKGWPELIFENGAYYSPAYKLLEQVSYAAFGISTSVATVHQDLTKNVIAPYLRQPHRKISSNWFGAQAMGKTINPNGKIEIAYVLRPGADEAGLLKAAWSITRLGSKEGIIAVEDASVQEVVPAEMRLAITAFYAPYSCVEVIEPGGEIIEFWDYRDPRAYIYGNTERRRGRGAKREEERIPSSTMKFVVPMEKGPYGGKMSVRVKEEGVILKLRETSLIVPRDVL